MRNSGPRTRSGPDDPNRPPLSYDGVECGCAAGWNKDSRFGPAPSRVRGPRCPRTQAPRRPRRFDPHNASSDRIPGMSEADNWSVDGRNILTADRLETIRRVLEDVGPVIVEHGHY